MFGERAEVEVVRWKTTTMKMVTTMMLIINMINNSDHLDSFAEPTYRCSRDEEKDIFQWTVRMLTVLVAGRQVDKVT